MKKTQMVDCGGALPADTVAGAGQYEQTRNGTSYTPNKTWSPTGALNP